MRKLITLIAAVLMLGALASTAAAGPSRLLTMARAGTAIASFENYGSGAARVRQCRRLSASAISCKATARVQLFVGGGVDMCVSRDTARLVRGRVVVRGGTDDCG